MFYTIYNTLLVQPIFKENISCKIGDILQPKSLSKTFKIYTNNVFIYLYKKFYKGFCNFLEILDMYTAYSAISMTLYLVLLSCLATVAIATWKIFEHGIQIPFL